MKRTLFIMSMLAASLSLMAQGEIKNGVWEEKQIVQAENISAITLYTRALESLSDWAGSQGKSKIGIDVQDKEQGLIVYKGDYYLGYEKANINPLYGWNTFANFTLKIRCKDGRAQVSVSVPSLTFRFTGNPTEVTAPIEEFLPEYNYKTKYTNKRAARELSPKVPTEFHAIIKFMCSRLANGTADDDF